MAKVGLNIYKEKYFTFSFIWNVLLYILTTNWFCCFCFVCWNGQRNFNEMVKWKNHNFVDFTKAQILHFTFSHVCLFAYYLLRLHTVSLFPCLNCNAFPCHFNSWYFSRKKRCFISFTWNNVFQSYFIGQTFFVQILKLLYPCSQHLNNYDGNFFNELQMVSWIKCCWIEMKFILLRNSSSAAES